jgi:hypothetical protein
MMYSFKYHIRRASKTLRLLPPLIRPQALSYCAGYLSPGTGAIIVKLSVPEKLL